MAATINSDYSAALRRLFVDAQRRSLLILMSPFDVKEKPSFTDGHTAISSWKQFWKFRSYLVGRPYGSFSINYYLDI
jgi:hypothetical protein